MVLHHKDGNSLHNELSNFELKPRRQHMADYMREPKRIEQSRKNMLTVVHDAARKWHGSPEGRKWHSEHAKCLIANRVIRTKLCEQCEKLFKYKYNTARFCSHKCWARSKRTGLQLAS